MILALPATSAPDVLILSLENRPAGDTHAYALAIPTGPSLFCFPLDRSANPYLRITYRESEVIRVVQRGRRNLNRIERPVQGGSDARGPELCQCPLHDVAQVA